MSKEFVGLAPTTTLRRKGRERPINDLARALRITQPRTSKHLRVLREVGLVRVREAGQRRLYGLDARGLQPVHEWVIGFEQYWNENFDRLNEYVKKLQQKEHADGSRSYRARTAVELQARA